MNFHEIPGAAPTNAKNKYALFALLVKSYQWRVKWLEDVAFSVNGTTMSFEVYRLIQEKVVKVIDQATTIRKAMVLMADADPSHFRAHIPRQVSSALTYLPNITLV